jgi:hypothetical protein
MSNDDALVREIRELRTRVDQLWKGEIPIAASRVWDWHVEQPSGTQDGSNCVFTHSHAIYPGSLVVYINGFIRVVDVEFEETTSTSFTLASPPSSTDILLTAYKHRTN